MPYIIVQLSPSAAAELTAGKPKTLEVRAVVRVVKAAGGSIAPMHPGVSDQELARYFSVDLPGGKFAATLAEELGHLPSVEAAYVKPDDAPPGG